MQRGAIGQPTDGLRRALPNSGTVIAVEMSWVAVEPPPRKMPILGPPTPATVAARQGCGGGVVPHTGFEPVISALRGRCPGPLDECGAGRRRRSRCRGRDGMIPIGIDRRHVGDAVGGYSR